MIKFRIHNKIWEGKKSRLGKVLQKCQNCRVFLISSDILDETKDNLGQECVKRSSIFPWQNWNNYP